jgi:hypothetical protein
LPVPLDDANRHNQLILQYLSKTKTPWQTDREVGDLSDDLLTHEPALTYLCYNIRLEDNSLNDPVLGKDLDYLTKNLDSLRKMSAGKNRNDLYLIGQKAAQKQVPNKHFPAAFNLGSAQPAGN